MSTRGSFIICRNGQKKEVYIDADAYPGGAGFGVVEIIKACNLDILYDCLVEFDEYDEEMAEALGDREPASFSVDLCREAETMRKKLYTRPSERYFIQNSLFCEYGYVIDMDSGELQFYIGGQRTPQEGNRFGNIPFSSQTMPEIRYYSCHLKASFSLDYVRAARSASIISEMEACQERTGIQYFTSDALVRDQEEQDDFSSQKEKLRLSVNQLGDRLSAMGKKISSLQPYSEKRIRELEYKCYKTGEAISDLEKTISILSRKDDIE